MYVEFGQCAFAQNTTTWNYVVSLKSEENISSTISFVDRPAEMKHNFFFISPALHLLSV